MGFEVKRPEAPCHNPKQRAAAPIKYYARSWAGMTERMREALSSHANSSSSRAWRPKRGEYEGEECWGGGASADRGKHAGSF